MDFDLTEHQRAVRADAREFARERIAPHARELDRAGAHATDVPEAAGRPGHARPPVGGSPAGPGGGGTDRARPGPAGVPRSTPKTAFTDPLVSGK